VTVEAEYGSTVVEGSLLTLAHHTPEYAHNPSPCTRPGGMTGYVEGVEVVGLSHVDLDSVGGTLAVLGDKPGPDSFWALAGRIDILGPHRLEQAIEEANARPHDVLALHAYWAWARTPEGRVMLPRDGSVADVTNDVMKHRSVLREIFNELRDNPGLGVDGGAGGARIEAGRRFAAEGAALQKASFVKMEGDVVLRTSPEFVNHLYQFTTGEGGITEATGVARAVVAFNSKTGAVTVSFASAPTGPVNARTIVQQLWGTEAGGHAGIAGSPRNQQMTMGDALAAFEAVKAALR
jgi:hypothetical protein